MKLINELLKYSEEKINDGINFAQWKEWDGEIITLKREDTRWVYKQLKKVFELRPGYKISLKMAIENFINIKEHAEDDLKCLNKLKWWQFFEYRKILKLCRENQIAMLSDIKMILCNLDSEER